MSQSQRPHAPEAPRTPRSGRLRRALGLLLPLLIAVGVSGLLYSGTRAVDEQRHAAILRNLERERRLQALLKREVLAARFGLLSQYDPLEAALGDVDATRRALGEQMKGAGARGADVSSALTRIEKASAARADRVQSFKRENAVLKNSLHYLPLAADLLSDRIAKGAGLDGSGGEPEGGDLRRDVNGLVQATLVYNLIGGDDRRRVQEQRLAALDARAGSLPAHVRPDFALFLAHARTVAKQAVVVDPLIQEIEDETVEEAIASLESGYQSFHAACLQRAARYRLALYVWSILLVVGVVAAVTKLVGLYGSLERLVQERTRELERALDALWGEMHLAKKIQAALIPVKAELQGCEVAAAMRPTDEVGGDYYDIVRIGGVEWILIGDVSGHGVPAGLVMMMCQTAVRAVLSKQPNTTPGELLAHVNNTLTENIRRLGENKYMTLQALRRDANGGFAYAGLHQDLLIYRAAKRRVEVVTSRGMWLGIVDDLAGMLHTDRIELATDDVLLLFTDGVTEAKRDGGMLDNDGLAKLLEVHGHASPSQIVERVLAELREYEIDDDVSLVVIKEGRHSGFVAAEPCGRLLEGTVS